MGRLPDSFAQRKITSRVPYAMTAHIDLASLQQGTFLPALFTHNVDRPFEIHRMIPRAASLSGASAVADLGMLGLAFSTLQFRDFTKQQDLLRVPTPPSSLVKGLGEMIWEWADPFYLERSEGFMVSISTENFSEFGFSIRTFVTFQGFLINIAPASDRRG